MCQTRVLLLHEEDSELKPRDGSPACGSTLDCKRRAQASSSQQAVGDAVAAFDNFFGKVTAEVVEQSHAKHNHFLPTLQASCTDRFTNLHDTWTKCCNRPVNV
eukprot:4910384-Amphidinium_carterae.1